MSESEREQLISQVINAIGAQQFNRCVESLSDTLQLGRLRYWQESLIERALPQLESDTRAYIAALGTFDAFTALFDGESRRPFAVTKDAFVARPIDYYDDTECKFDTDWLDAALSSVEFREHLYGDIVVVLCVSTDWGDVAATRILLQHLPTSLWVECYNYINHELAVPEGEWRGEFETMFPSASPHLPKPST